MQGLCYFFYFIFSKTKQEIKTSQNINELKRAPDDNRQADKYLKCF